MPLRAVLLVLLLTLVAAGSAAAQAPAPPAVAVTLAADAPGRLAVTLAGPPGAAVGLQERAGGVAEPLPAVTLDAAGRATVPDVAPWRCDRTERTVEATIAGAVVGSATVTTPGCADRLALTLPKDPRAGRDVTLRVSDRWRLGDVAARLCIAAPGARGAGDCRTVTLAPGEVRTGATFRPPRGGRFTVRFTGPDGTTARRTLAVAPASTRLRVLATGDSMIQILDGLLEQRLGALGRVGAGSFRSDAHISTGISKPFMFDWVAHARASARDVHPDVTVMFLGANDGFPIGDAACCGEDWVAAYAARARAMMRSYARDGAGTVYWLLLPAPRSEQFRQVFTPVNRALRLAAASFPGIVHLVDLGAIFTPGGVFRRQMTWEGRTVTVRQDDGVHLSLAGAGIAAQLVVRELRRDGLVR